MSRSPRVAPRKLDTSEAVALAGDAAEQMAILQGQLTQWNNNRNKNTNSTYTTITALVDSIAKHQMHQDTVTRQMETLTRESAKPGTGMLVQMMTEAHEMTLERGIDLEKEIESKTASLKKKIQLPDLSTENIVNQIKQTKAYRLILLEMHGLSPTSDLTLDTSSHGSTPKTFCSPRHQLLVEILHQALL